MLETAHKLIRRVGSKAGLSEKDIQNLLKSDAHHEFEITLSSGKTHKAYRVQHSNKLGPYKGGIRFHPEVNAEEVRALATLMSLKTAAIGLPLGGGKGGVAINARELSSAELEELARKYVQHLHPHIGPDKDIPAPDVYTSSDIIDWMVDEYEKQTGDTSKASFTGKSLGKGGSEGREEATGRGGAIALQELLKLMGEDKTDLSIGIQGFGNVGSHFGLIAEKEHPNWQLVAATDSSGGINSPFGLSAKKLTSYKMAGKRLTGYPEPSGIKITNEQLLTEDLDILVLAALGDVINEKNMKEIKARFILELANGPVSEEAHNFLTKKGVVVVPDIIANAGGVIVSYLEWLQNKSTAHWSLEKVNAKLNHYIKNAVQNVYMEHRAHNLSLKEAAYLLALKRLSKSA